MRIGGSEASTVDLVFSRPTTFNWTNRCYFSASKPLVTHHLYDIIRTYITKSVQVLTPSDNLGNVLVLKKLKFHDIRIKPSSAPLGEHHHGLPCIAGVL